MNILARSGFFKLEAGSVPSSSIDGRGFCAWFCESDDGADLIVGFGKGATQAEAGRAALEDARKDTRSEVRFAVRDCYAEMPGRNARFWAFVNLSWVKLTLKPGQSLAWGTGGRTDEGYSAESSQWEFDGETVLEQWAEWGRDCDGGHERSGERHCTLDMLRAQEADATEYGARPERPEWTDGAVECRDEYAEAAGY